MYVKKLINTTYNIWVPTLVYLSRALTSLRPNDFARNLVESFNSCNLKLLIADKCLKLISALLRTGLYISLDVLPSWGDQDHVLQARMLWLFSCCTKRHKRECVESSGWQKDCFEPQIECFESEYSKSSGWCFPSFPSFLHVLFNLLNVLPSKMAGYNNL